MRLGIHDKNEKNKNFLLKNIYCIKIQPIFTFFINLNYRSLLIYVLYVLNDF